MKPAIFYLLLIVLASLSVKAQDNYNFFLSNSGSDSNSGVSRLLPRRTLAGTDPVFRNYASTHGLVNIGLRAGDTFNDFLLPNYPLQVSSYNDNPTKKDFAILSGADVFDNGWQPLPGTDHIYRQDIPVTGFMSNPIGNYSYVYVYEIDKALESTAPLTARKLLVLAPSLVAADTIPGSFYDSAGSVSPIKLFIHTSDGATPNGHTRFRYEVSVRGRAIFDQGNNNSRFENLMIRGYGAGDGLIHGGNNVYFNNVIFGPGAAIHHIVLKSGNINHSLFLRGPKNVGEFSIVFYDVEGFQRHNSVSNSIFLDIEKPIYNHNSYGSNYASIDIKNVLSFADTLEAGYFMGSANNDTVRFTNVYTDKHTYGYWNISPKFLSIDDSYFRDVTIGVLFEPNPVTATVRNVFIKSKWSAIGIGVQMRENVNLNLENSIIHISSKWGFFIGGAAANANHITARGNIFIADVNTGQVVTAAKTNTNNGIRTSTDIWDNNVYILLKGSKITWQLTNGATNGGSTTVQSFTEWKNQSGQDQNSLFFDLRNDPRGLKAIFVDPDNGNYELTDSPEANQVRTLNAGMTNPITCFLQKPSYEAAAEMIGDGKIFSANSCKSPCRQTNIRVASSFTASIMANRQVKIEWTVTDPLNIDHYDIERSIGNSAFINIYSIAAGTDSVYSFMDNDIQSNIVYNYRLCIVATNGDKCFSETKPIKSIDNHQALLIYPNPGKGLIKLALNDYTGPASISITNSLGQLLFKRDATILYGVPQLLDLSALSKGVYCLKAQLSSGDVVKKIFIE